MNLTKLTESYISEHPIVKECLKKGLINYSALARQIISENSLNEKKDSDAVLVAVRRSFEKIKVAPENEKKLIQIAKKAKLEIRNKIGVTILDSRISFDKLNSLVKELSERSNVFHLIHGTSTITLIAPQEFQKSVSSKFPHHIIHQKSNLVEIAIKTTSDVETVLGWEAFLSGLLAENNISFYECIGSWEDNIYIISEKDLAKAMQVLSF